MVGGINKLLTLTEVGLVEGGGAMKTGPGMLKNTMAALTTIQANEPVSYVPFRCGSACTTCAPAA